MQQPKSNFWKDKIKAWEKSGLSQPRFCRRMKVSLSAFRYWKHRLAGTGEKPGFVKVTTAEVVRSGRIRVDYESGIQISFDSTVPVATISRIVEVVGEAVCTSIGKK